MNIKELAKDIPSFPTEDSAKNVRATVLRTFL